MLDDAYYIQEGGHPYIIGHVTVTVTVGVPVGVYCLRYKFSIFGNLEKSKKTKNLKK